MRPMRSGYVVVKREREAQEREKEKEEERERARERDEREGGRWRERVSRLYCACQWLVLRRRGGDCGLQIVSLIKRILRDILYAVGTSTPFVGDVRR